MTRHFLWAFIVLLSGVQSFAAPSINLTGVSNSANANGATTPTFYISNMGSAYTPAAGNCDRTKNATCLNLSDSFTISTVSSATNTSGGQLYIFATNGTAITNLSTTTGIYKLYQTAYPTGTGVINYTTTLQNFCTNLSTISLINADCTPTTAGLPTNLTIAVILDVDNSITNTSGDDVGTVPLVIMSSIEANSSIASQSGLYQFIAFPGDAKVHFKSVTTDTTFPTSENSIGIQYVRFYFAKDAAGGFADIDTTSTNYFQASVIDTAGNLSSYFHTGLVNDSIYYYRAALVDYAGNIGYITPSTDDGSTVPNDNDHVAQPGVVVGLLSKNPGCFVATAAFGSPMARQVQILRDFRDQILLKSKSGQKFVSWYYDKGPYWAGIIEKHDDLRALVRLLLWPLILFGYLAVKLGAANASMLFAILVLFPFLVIRFKNTSKVLRHRS